MITEIGIVAGEIWHYLDEHGDARFGDIVKDIGRPNELALMSLGWLAREGHVVVNPSGGSTSSTLRVALRH